MKKIFAFVAAALVSLGAMAVDGVNVMASGLKSVVNADATEMTIDYVLNTEAIGVTVQFFDAAGDLAAEVELEDAALLTAGAHQTTVEIPLDELEEGETYSWGIVAEGGTTTFADVLPADDNRYNYYMPMGIVVDNSFESEYFGRIYLSEATDGASDGMSEATKNQVRGIYIYDTELNFVNGQQSAVLGYDGGLGGDRTATTGFRRLAIDRFGYVYVATLDDDTKGVYRMDPSAPDNAFVQVLEGSRPVNALEIVEDTLYTIENVSETTGEFDIYDMTTIPVGKPLSRKLTADTIMQLANPYITIRSDKRGGFWVAQSRWGYTYKPFMHWNANKEVDYQITGSVNSEVLGDVSNNVSYRGQLALNVAGDKIALASNKCAKVYSISYDDDGVPSLSLICMTPELGGNIDGLAFDVAENLYVASASVERFYVFPMAKEEGMNHCLVKAAARYEVTIPGDLPQAPETAPAVPTHDEADVMAIYCNHYTTNNANFGISGWAGAYQTLDIDGTKIGAWTAMTWECIIDPANTDAPHDFSAYKNVHVDMWAPAAAKIKFTAEAITGGNYKDGMVADLVAGWNSFDFAIAQWPGNYNFANMKCFVLEQFQTPTGESFEGNPFAIANIYFWNEPTSVENVAAETKAVKVVRDGQVLILRNGVEYNLLGSEMK